MKAKSAQDCIHRILTDIEKRRTVNYADRNSVRRYNAAMDRILENANYLCEHYPNQMHLYMELLDDPNYEIAATLTGILFHLRHSTREHKLAAIASARRLINHPDADEIEKNYGWPTNIERWESEIAE